ncbi:hypothetical protein M514_02035 [Trichuris suis]|uniref:Uncharacterized protein n=1 Tax=Trichuris suis TaxID=68888 RepID=A0A085N299_9BILA|nr:hypothetical protein M513_02035 [Trichuris suis]KFD63595.1 hypothetical protein M514_02035 [Trichuris suis]
MLLLLLLGAFTHLLSAVPVKEHVQHELLERELDVGQHSSKLAKRGLDLTSAIGHEQHAELEQAHLARLRRDDAQHALLPDGSEQHQLRFKRGFGKWVKKKWGSVRKGASKLVKGVKKVFPKKGIPIIRYERRF